MDQHAKIIAHTADTVSALAILGAFAGILPPLAALGAFIWYLVQIWESNTVQRWLRKRRHVRRARRHYKRLIDSRRRG